MADVLARIVARKRSEVAARLSGPVAAAPTRRSLRAALARPGARFIMEVKRASPSGHRSAVGVERSGRGLCAGRRRDQRAHRRRRLWRLARRPARSCATRFDGPILAKDFIVDPAQVSEARAHGADAVLVMMSVLDDAAAAAVLGEAKRLGMDAIVEVHDEAELARALALGAAIVGINNRDLKTLTTDLAVTERLAPLVPKDVLVISESGISSRADVERLAPRRRRLPGRVGADGGGGHRRSGARAGPRPGQVVRADAARAMSSSPRARARPTPGSSSSPARRAR